MQENEITHLQAEITKADDGSFIAVASTNSVDRHGEIVDNNGWDLKAFKKNPVILWGHDHNEPAIGVSKRTWVEGSGKKARLMITPVLHDVTERARAVKALIEMVASIAGTGALSASVIGQLQAIATLAGSSTVTAAQSALAGMVASLAGTGVISDAQQEALGQMIATIYVNEGAATVDQIVDGVVENLGSITATVPNLLDTETGSVIIPLD